VEFEWDAEKEVTNMEKHGVDFKEAASSFADPLGFAGYDKTHSGKKELRWFWFGQSARNRILTVRYT